MFSFQHIIWLLICFAIVILCRYLIARFEIGFDKVLAGCIIVCIASEFTKIFSSITVLPLVDGSGCVPYLEMSFLPLHLCSIQIVFIFILKYTDKNSKFYRILLAFVYPTSIAGAVGALLVPTVFTSSVPPKEAFSHPIVYQYFLFHTMLIILGLSIYHFYGQEFNGKDCINAAIMSLSLFFISLYVNSVFSIPRYDEGVLVGIEKSVNFFISFRPPIDIQLLSKSAWLLYLCILFAIGILIVFVLYLPVLLRSKKKTH